jgi:putative methionine-R-sulfoxide reductase with GAF domain
MYDPLIVDTFIAVHADIAPPVDEQADSQGLSAISRDVHPRQHDAGSDSGFDDISASTDEMLVLFEMARSLTASVGATDAAERVAKQLRRILPPTTTVFYTYDQAHDELAVSYAGGEHAELFHGLRIPRGQRLTGWVAANRQTILNSDPVLDLGEIARSARPRLRTCLSTPLLIDDAVVGVLSLYSTQRDDFTREHKRIAEAVARQVSPVFKQHLHVDAGTIGSTRGERSPQASARTARSLGLEDLVETAFTDRVTIALIQLTTRGDYSGRPTEEIVGAVAGMVRAALRGADVLFRYSGNELVVLFGSSGADTADTVARRLADLIGESDKVSRSADAPQLAVKIGTAVSPSDGITIDSLIAVARLKGQSLDDFTQRPTSIH